MIVVGVYLLGFLLSWPVLARCAFRWEAEGWTATRDDYYVATFLGLCLALIWPLMIPAAFVLHVLQSDEGVK